MIRLAALGLWHEANTFAAQPLDQATVAQKTLRGDHIIRANLHGTTTMSGYLAAGEWPGVQVVPLVMTRLTPAGPLTADALRHGADEMVAALVEHGPFDGVLAALHGAAVAEDVTDVDGYLLGLFREAVGPDVPIGVSLDLHANISAEMCVHSNVLNAYRTNPHLDAKECAEEVAQLIVRAVRGEISPTQALVRVPAVINILCQNTSTPPMREILDDARAVMLERGVLSVTVAEGYPYADVPEMGMAVVVVTDSDALAAARHASRLAERVWAHREQFEASAVSPEVALRYAAEAAEGPVLLLDIGDNIGAGSPGDSVTLLHAARRVGLRSVLVIIADPDAVLACERAGVGAQVKMSVGARVGPETEPPVDATCTVLALHHGRYEATEAVHAGMSSLDAGRSAAVQLDTGQTVILTTRPTLPLTTAQLRTLGLEPAQFKAIVAKGVHSPLAGYGPYVADVVPVDTPGITAADLRRFVYQRRPRPLYPFEDSPAFGGSAPTARTTP